MDYLSPNMPLQAYFIESEKTMSNRIPFKCRIVEEGGLFYNRVIGGVIDTGTNAMLITKTDLPYKSGCKVILDDILYSVVSIQPFIPDTVAQGIYKRKPHRMFMVQLA
jgi:hypothetical protein